MAPNATPLCKYDLPSGKLCRQIALKDEQVCRHHMRLFRQDMHDCTRQEAEERFSARLEQMDLPELLLTLQCKLSRIERTIPAWHEARIILRVALDHLRKRNEEEARRIQLARQHPLPDMKSPELQNLMEKLINQ